MNIEQLAKNDLKDIVYKQQELILKQQRQIKEINRNREKNQDKVFLKVKNAEQHSEVQTIIEVNPRGDIVYFTLKSIFTIDIRYKVVSEYYKKINLNLILSKFELDLDLENTDIHITKIYKNNDYWNIQFKCKENTRRGVLIKNGRK